MWTMNKIEQMGWVWSDWSVKASSLKFARPSLPSVHASGRFYLSICISVYIVVCIPLLYISAAPWFKCWSGSKRESGPGSLHFPHQDQDNTLWSEMIWRNLHGSVESVELLARVLPCVRMSSKVVIALSVSMSVCGHKDEQFGRISNTCSLFLLQRSYKWKKL